MLAPFCAYGIGPYMLTVQQLCVAYQKQRILHNIDLEFSSSGFTALVGANGSGKTTLLHTLAGLLKAEQGRVYLNGKNLNNYSKKEIARELAMLPQITATPIGLTARELIMQGRFPWQSWWNQWSDDDEQIFDFVIKSIGIEDYLDTPIEQLSGGQRQRCWIAMIVVQDTPFILLDEPTTYLDISHQVELMNLIASLCMQGKKIIAVLHDLNQAAAYADKLIMLKQGKIFTQGSVKDTFTSENIKAVFDITTNIITCPHTGNPICVPFTEESALQKTDDSKPKIALV